MGTPDFAVLPLQTLITNNYHVVGVVTSPDKPAGRGQQISTSAVKKCAKEMQLPIFQPTNLKSQDFIDTIIALNPDIIIVVAFRMLPKLVWEIPSIGTLNLHASLLPQYRGAAPINWAIVNGETKTGVTSFFINEAIDTGNIILQKTVSIHDSETAGELHDKLMVCASELMIETLEALEKNPNKGISQDSISNVATLRHAPKISKETCKINWNSNSQNVFNHIRGFSPYPGAWTLLKKETSALIFKIFSAELILENHSYPAGTIINISNEIVITTIDGFIKPIDIQLEGKKRMNMLECSRGFSFETYVAN
jgi:methionyl-tRNA formyltransferase